MKIKNNQISRENHKYFNLAKERIKLIKSNHQEIFDKITKKVFYHLWIKGEFPEELQEDSKELKEVKLKLLKKYEQENWCGYFENEYGEIKPTKEQLMIEKIKGCEINFLLALKYKNEIEEIEQILETTYPILNELIRKAYSAKMKLRDGSKSRRHSYKESLKLCKNLYKKINKTLKKISKLDPWVNKDNIVYIREIYYVDLPKDLMRNLTIFIRMDV